MMKDLTTRTDIDLLMRVFYEKALADEVIGYIFTDVARLDLEKHLPIIGDFWESAIFGTSVYARHGRNPMLVHKELHLKEPLLPEHFDRWLEIFHHAVDAEFRGETAERVKDRATAIASRFQAFLSVQPKPPSTRPEICAGNRLRRS